MYLCYLINEKLRDVLFCVIVVVLWCCSCFLLLFGKLVYFSSVCLLPIMTEGDFCLIDEDIPHPDPHNQTFFVKLQPLWRWFCRDGVNMLNMIQPCGTPAWPLLTFSERRVKCSRSCVCQFRVQLTHALQNLELDCIVGTQGTETIHWPYYLRSQRLLSSKSLGNLSEQVRWCG